MPLEVGTVVSGRYEVLRTLRSGGMGALYEVRDAGRPGPSLALKEMLEGFSDPDEQAMVRRRFGEEARMLRALSHPGIPAIHDFFFQDDSVFLVMEFIRGQDLEQELQDYLSFTRRPFPPESLVRDVLGILEILEYLHGQDPPVVHRDLKPANLIRDWKTGQVRLVDFGLARHVRPGGKTSQTLVGTLGYCPLEQMQGHSEPRSDLYALGATMHHLLSGRAPRFLDLPPLAEIMPEVDPRLAAVVDRAVATDPGARFPDGAAMARALRAWLESRGGGEVGPAPTVPVRAADLPPGAARRLEVQVWEEPAGEEVLEGAAGSAGSGVRALPSGMLALVAGGLLVLGGAVAWSLAGGAPEAPASPPHRVVIRPAGSFQEPSPPAQGGPGQGSPGQGGPGQRGAAAAGTRGPAQQSEAFQLPPLQASPPRPAPARPPVPRALPRPEQAPDLPPAYPRATPRRPREGVPSGPVASARPSLPALQASQSADAPEPVPHEVLVDLDRPPDGFVELGRPTDPNNPRRSLSVWVLRTLDGIPVRALQEAAAREVAGQGWTVGASVPRSQNLAVLPLRRQDRSGVLLVALVPNPLEGSRLVVGLGDVPEGLGTDRRLRELEDLFVARLAGPRLPGR